MDRNVLLTIEYDGTNFYGWQRQPGLRTVQGELENLLSTVCREPIVLNGTSRTDAGVHALGQRASFSGDFGIPIERIPIACNNMLRGGMNARCNQGDIRIISAEEKPAGFHARFNAKGKTYRYVIDNRPETDVFRRNYAYGVNKPLDIKAIRSAAEKIVGTHDFACFQAAGGTPRETTVRTVTSLNVSGSAGNDIVLEITGDGFLYNMVRIIAGTLVDVGLSKIAPCSMEEIISSGERQRAGHTAPPCGLYLVEVYY